MSAETRASKSPIELEIQAYMDLPGLAGDRVEDNPEDFWIKNTTKFPLLSSLALDILAIPAASSAPERIFAIVTAATMGKANRLSGGNLERKVLAFRNTDFLPDVDE